MATNRTPNPVDVHVGARVRLRRLLIDMSQEKLAGLLGLTFQQVQKYEKGVNRIGAGRLQDIARILSVPVSFFFENAPGAPEGANDDTGTEERGVVEFLSTPEGVALVRAFMRIKDAAQRRTVVNLVRSMAEAA